MPALATMVAVAAAEEVVEAEVYLASQTLVPIIVEVVGVDPQRRLRR